GYPPLGVRAPLSVSPSTSYVGNQGRVAEANQPPRRPPRPRIPPISDSLPAPLHEAFQGVKFRQAERVVHLRRVRLPALGRLPELTVAQPARDHRPFLLRLVAENRQLLALQIGRAQRHHPLDLVRLPPPPGAAVEPDLELLALLPHLAHRREHRVG